MVDTVKQKWVWVCGISLSFKEDARHIKAAVVKHICELSWISFTPTQKREEDFSYVPDVSCMLKPNSHYLGKVAVKVHPAWTKASKPRK